MKGMAPGVVRLSDDANAERRLERQMGCMAGFLQIFDRNQFLAGKRVGSPKRLPSVVQSPDGDVHPAASPQGVKTVATPGNQSPAFTPNARAPVVVCREQQKVPLGIKDVVRGSVFRESNAKPPEKQEKTPEKPAAVAKKTENPKLIDAKDGFRSSWRLREGPRLSLDSRAMALRPSGGLFPREIRTSIVRPECSADESEDGERQRRSPSVVARLMGLDALPDSSPLSSCPDAYNRAEHRRSASESRASRELLPFAWRAEADEQQRRQSNVDQRTEVIGRKSSVASAKEPWRFQLSKGFESAEIFPDGRRAGNLYGEIERRLKMRGIDEPGKDLETLKQILEALQLKGLLHSAKSDADESRGGRNFVFEHRKQSAPDSPIVVMKPLNYVRPSSPSPPPPANRNRGLESTARLNRSTGRMPQQVRRQPAMEVLPPAKPRRSSPTPSPANDRALRKVRTPPAVLPKSPGRGRDPEKNSPRQMPSPPRPPSAGRRLMSESGTARSPRNRKRIDRECFTAEIPAKEDESSTISESSRSTSSVMDSEAARPTPLRKDEYSEGRILLDRCDKLLQSIAEATEQRSPVSVLDASFHEDCSPSPGMKRSIVFREGRLSMSDEGLELRSKESLASSGYDEDGIDEADLDDFRYVSDVVLASNLLQNTQAIGKSSGASCAVFSLLESRRKPGDSDSLRAHRRLVFDTVTELLQRRRQQTPAKAAEAFVADRRLLRQIWAEFRSIRRTVAAEDVFEVVSGVIRKDMSSVAAGEGWEECAAEMGDSVLDIERLIFKDLVADTIRELAFLIGGKPKPIRRQLVF
ncbi:LONGIFOLIA 1 protein [Nymphaea thermarum]|nr:LONGIFOLIA 1 protein [Nymphaea thermarum]